MYTFVICAMGTFSAATPQFFLFTDLDSLSKASRSHTAYVDARGYLCKGNWRSIVSETQRFEALRMVLPLRPIASDLDGEGSLWLVLRRDYLSSSPAFDSVLFEANVRGRESASSILLSAPLYLVAGLHITALIECGGTGICSRMQYLRPESTPVSSYTDHRVRCKTAGGCSGRPGYTQCACSLLPLASGTRAR